MKPKLCKAGVQLREQIDDSFKKRYRSNDGWAADLRHINSGKPSDHIPDADTGIVYAIDVDARLSDDEGDTSALASELRFYAKYSGRIHYVIYKGRISSPVLKYTWRKYFGSNRHNKHIHISFKKDNDSSEFFNIPLLGGKNE